MKNGYINLWRKSLDSGLLKNHKIWTFWTWCLLKASYKKHKQIIDYQEIELLPGQFIFGRKKAADELKMSEQNIRTCVQFLKKAENLTIKVTNKFSIITICNWENYQSLESINQPSSQPMTNQQLTTNNKDNKGKNIYSEKFFEKNSDLTKRFQEKIKPIKDEISDESYNKWIAPLLFIEMKYNIIFLFHETPIWVEEHYKEKIEKLIGGEIKVVNEFIEY